MTRNELIRKVSERAYIGDAVYVHLDPTTSQTVLETHDGVRVLNRIYLDNSVLAAFDQWRVRMNKLMSQKLEPDK